MPPKLPPHLHRQITRHGKAVWYFRRGKGAASGFPANTARLSSSPPMTLRSEATGGP